MGMVNSSREKGEEEERVRVRAGEDLEGAGGRE